jgi:GntR family transcriptional repressor for pyruvate dehydrogenase complex
MAATGERLMTNGADRLYERLARQLISELKSGKYKVGERLPAERELATEYQVSRPAVREAMIALEVQGLVDVRIGSGAYVKRLPGTSDKAPGFHATAFEVTEARLLFEGEAAALAAEQISDEELAELDGLITQMSRSGLGVKESEAADKGFHLLIARATRNSVIIDTVERLWELRATSPDCILLHEKSRDAGNRPVPDEHNAVASALRRRDPAAARAAMRAHLDNVIDYLLFATEERAIAEARRAIASTRQRYGRAASR